MNSSFSTHYIASLPTPAALPEPSESHPSSKKQNLQSLYVSLKQPLSRSDTRDTLQSLDRIERDETAAQAFHDREEFILKRAVIGKIVIGLYAEALDTYLTEATDAEAEAEWWADIERSRWNIVYYFIQSEYLFIPSVFGACLKTLIFAIPQYHHFSSPNSTAPFESYRPPNSPHSPYSSNSIDIYSIIPPPYLFLNQCPPSQCVDKISVPSPANTSTRLSFVLWLLYSITAVYRKQYHAFTLDLDSISTCNHHPPIQPDPT
jgi:hypothetical protein